MAYCSLLLGIVGHSQSTFRTCADCDRILLLGTIAIVGQQHLKWIDVSSPCRSRLRLIRWQALIQPDVHSRLHRLGVSIHFLPTRYQDWGSLYSVIATAIVLPVYAASGIRSAEYVFLEYVDGGTGFPVGWVSPMHDHMPKRGGR